MTYGVHPVPLELMRRARARGIALIFHMYIFGCGDRREFADLSGVISPSEYSRRHCRRTVGPGGPVFPDPIRLDKVILGCQWSVVSGQSLNAPDCAVVARSQTSARDPLQLTTDKGPLTPGAIRGSTRPPWPQTRWLVRCSGIPIGSLSLVKLVATVERLLVGRRNRPQVRPAASRRIARVWCVHGTGFSAFDVI
jgi:hypothetical protein